MMNGSPMDDYMANYGARLQSLLDGNGMAPSAMAASQGAGPGSALVPGQAAAAGIDRPQLPQAGGGAAVGPGGGPASGGTSFRDKWAQTSDEQKKQATDDLEKQLKQGNETIDSAYNGLIKQLGERPGPDTKLSREDKGMILMEFGLSLMVNSSGKPYGPNLGAAVGASGLQAMQSHLGRRRQERDDFDKQSTAINLRRADAKADLAKQSALEARSEARDDRRADRENSQLVGIVTQPDNSVVGYTRGGQASVLELPGGKSVQAKPKPVGTGAGGPRTLAEERRYQMYMETYGKDANGQPLTGAQLDTVKKRALQFSADPKASVLSDNELRSMAERSADAFQKSNWAQFRDMKPDEIKKWRDKAADENYKRLKAGEDASMELPPPPQKAPGRGSSGKSALASPRAYTSMDQIRSALASKEVSMGDTVMLNGKPFKIQPKRTQ